MNGIEYQNLEKITKDRNATRRLLNLTLYNITANGIVEDTGKLNNKCSL